MKLRSTPVGWPPKAGASCAPRPASITSCTPEPAARPHNRHLIPGASSRIAGRRSQQDGRPLFETFTFHSLPPEDEALRPAIRALAEEAAASLGADQRARSSIGRASCRERGCPYV